MCTVCVYVTTRCENRRRSAEPHNRQHYPESGRVGGGGREGDDATVSIEFGKMPCIYGISCNFRDFKLRIIAPVEVRHTVYCQEVTV